MADMRALGQTEFGEIEVIKEMKLPVPEATGADLRVRVHAVGINPVDVKARQDWNGFGSMQGGMPAVLGWDASGVVDAVGPQADGRFKVGDAVYFSGSISRPGAQREYTVVDSRIVGRKPKNLTHAQAAALPLTTITAWEGLVDIGGMRFDAGRRAQTVLIVGGAGGLGSVATQIAARAAGACVVATASRPETVAYCKSMGATHVINHHQPLAPQLNALGISAVNLVLHTSEPDDNFDEIGALVAPLGRIVCVLPITRPVDTAPLFARSISIAFELIFTRPLFGVDLARQGEILDQVAGLVESGTMQSTLVTQLPWSVASVQAAHAAMDSRRGIGKTVLSIREN